MSLIWRCAGHSQRIRITTPVLQHLAKHRQLSGTATEAGGQLFGSVSRNEVIVAQATGPYRDDERSRFQYRSDEATAQRAIAARAKHGVIYLGEWHTHAEARPTPSGSDESAMASLFARSSLNTSSVLLIIVGCDTSHHGLCVSSFGESGRLDWRCGEAPDTDPGLLARFRGSSLGRFLGLSPSE